MADESNDNTVRPPLKRVAFHVMTALANQRLHGLGIVRDVLEQTHGELKLWPAALYATLEQLADEGQIEAVTADGTPHRGDAAGRRYFALTAYGRETLWCEVRRIEAETEVARGRLRLNRASTR